MHGRSPVFLSSVSFARVKNVSSLRSPTILKYCHFYPKRETLASNISIGSLMILHFICNSSNHVFTYLTKSEAEYFGNLAKRTYLSIPMMRYITV